MLVQMRSVEKSEAVCILREMGGYPVQYNSDTALVQFIYQQFKTFRIAETRGRGVVSGKLVAPGRVVGKFHDRHELHMCKTHILDIGLSLIHISEPTRR